MAQEIINIIVTAVSITLTLGGIIVGIVYKYSKNKKKSCQP